MEMDASDRSRQSRPKHLASSAAFSQVALHPLFPPRCHQMPNHRSISSVSCMELPVGCALSRSTLAVSVSIGGRFGLETCTASLSPNALTY